MLFFRGFCFLRRRIARGQQTRGQEQEPYLLSVSQELWLSPHRSCILPLLSPFPDPDSTPMTSAISCRPGPSPPCLSIGNQENQTNDIAEVGLPRQKHPSSVVSFFAANDVEGFVDYEERPVSRVWCLRPSDTYRCFNSRMVCAPDGP